MERLHLKHHLDGISVGTVSQAVELERLLYLFRASVEKKFSAVSMSMVLVSATLLWPFRQQSRRGRPVLNSGEVAALSKDAQGVASPAIPEGIGGEADEGPYRHVAALNGGPATMTCSLSQMVDAGKE